MNARIANRLVEAALRAVDPAQAVHHAIQRQGSDLRIALGDGDGQRAT
jgi:hypothetical protein